MLEKAMRGAGVTSREAFVLCAAGNGARAAKEAVQSQANGTALWDQVGAEIESAANNEPDTLPETLRSIAARHGLDGGEIVLLATRIAGRLNGRDTVPLLADDPRYREASNRKGPKRIDSTLALYDCINCDLCITACPNDAIFAYEAATADISTEVLTFRGDREPVRDAGQGFVIRESHQLAVVEAACNECSNCEVYCPEHGAPFLIKEHLFLTTDHFRELASREGFCREGNVLHARIEGIEMTLTPDVNHNRAIVDADGIRIELSWDPFEVRRCLSDPTANLELDTRALWRMKTAWESIFNASRPNTVNPVPTHEV
jgi:Fe-S-cluster-containing hydrogenase component 2